MWLMAVAGPVREPVNLGNPEEFTINDMAKVVLAAIPTGSRLVYHPLPVDDPRQRCPDITRARMLLDWQPRVRFAEALERTIAWFRTQVVVQDGELKEAVRETKTGPRTGPVNNVSSVLPRPTRRRDRRHSGAAPAR